MTRVLADTAAPPAAQAFGSQADFARVNGWAKSYVTALKQQGRLVVNEAGEVDFEASLKLIKATAGAPERSAPAVQGAQFADSQDRERFYSAELKRLDYEREIRKLRDAAEVASAVEDAGALVRSTIESWRDRLPPQLAALGGDEARIAAFIRGECEHLQRRLAEKFAALAGPHGDH